MTPRFMRVTSAFVLVTFLTLILEPATVRGQVVEGPVDSPPAPGSPDERVSRLLADLGELLEERSARGTRVSEPEHERTAGRVVASSDARADSRMRALRSTLRGIEELGPTLRDSFDTVERHLVERRLPAQFLQRHRQALARLEATHAEFRGLAARLGVAIDSGSDPQAALQELSSLVSRLPGARKPRRIDPNKLPWRSPTPNVRKPRTQPDEFSNSGLFEASQEPMTRAGVPAIGQLLPASLAFTAGDEELDETEDVRITQAIRDLAATLGNNPVRIYDWVRDNIEFLPSHGSIQGSDLTRQTRRGNAFDTSSLLIALLRAAGIRSRYVFGTIEVDADRAMNWVGGVTVPEAAMNLMGQGGIPNLGVMSGGKLARIRLEHVWVEAFVDYIPSRGAVHRQGDTWIPMDASFKQYNFSAGIDLKTNVPFDAGGFLERVRREATINEQEGWVRDVSQTAAQQTLESYQAQVKAFLDTHKPNATLGDVLGSRTIVPRNSRILEGTLPYRTVATGARLAAIPDSLRWKFRYDLYATDGDRANDNPLFSVTRSTPELAGSKITLSFAPATQGDADVIRSYAPPPNPDGSPLRMDQLPQSLPGYLIHLVPELRVDESVVARSALASVMGTELVQSTAFFNPSLQQWEVGEDNRPIAGEYHAVVVDAQGISHSQLTALDARLDDLRARLAAIRQNPGDPTPAIGLTRDRITGDLLHSVALAYFASIDSYSSLAVQLERTVVANRMPSYGTASMTATTRFWFGIPRSVSMTGLTLDIDRVAQQAEAKDASAPARLAFLAQVGLAGSSYEHLVPEVLFADPGLPASDSGQPQGVSAVKLLAIAAAQGQKIYSLGPANRSAHAPALAALSLDADAEAEIADALAAGMNVTFHEATVTSHGWTGAGYIILNPENGGGAYRLSGGANGGWILILFVAAFLLLAVVLEVALAIVLAAHVIELIAFVLGIAIHLFATLALTPAQALAVSAVVFLGALLWVGLLVAAGYVLVFGMFLAVITAAAWFLYSLGRALWYYRPGPV
jgi:transglutaminase-like putative cysteine protease